MLCAVHRSLLVPGKRETCRSTAIRNEEDDVGGLLGGVVSGKTEQQESSQYAAQDKKFGAHDDGDVFDWNTHSMSPDVTAREMLRQAGSVTTPDPFRGSDMEITERSLPQHRKADEIVEKGRGHDCVFEAVRLAALRSHRRQTKEDPDPLDHPGYEEMHELVDRIRIVG
jgi:hypothetical protein